MQTNVSRKQIMKSFSTLTGAVLLSGLLAASFTTWAAEHEHGQPAGKESKLKPYPLKTCLITGEKLGGMGDPYVLKYKDREIKFCCKGCVKDFNKDPDKYVKLIEAAEKKAAK